VMERLLYDIAQRRGLGAHLAKGVKAMADALPGVAAARAAHVKGLEITAYHPEYIMGTALGYAVSSRGGDFNNVYASLEYSWSNEEATAAFGTPKAADITATHGKGDLIKKAVVANLLVDSLGLCKVPVLSLLRSFDLEPETHLLNALTGLDVTPQALFDMGKGLADVERAFNLAHGGPGLRDTLPPMFLDQGRLSTQTLETMVQSFYRAMDWDHRGHPHLKEARHDPLN
ncbi:MAG: aldehyde ferredoxin oxidoreductase C-terminal domain-containing protein, partial [Desulfobacterales bacterium]|nr:aldehyde ferredoxin oxidoreductase C-terminal domain-containing protein [Desulfobacterales bacterium]